MTKILVALVECLVECLVEWAAWAAWAAWVCKPIHFTKNYKKPSFYWAFFCLNILLEHEESTKKKTSNESII
jgi:hypothetical protein